MGIIRRLIGQKMGSSCEIKIHLAPVCIRCDRFAPHRDLDWSHVSDIYSYLILIRGLIDPSIRMKLARNEEYYQRELTTGGERPGISSGIPDLSSGMTTIVSQRNMWNELLTDRS
jgi:hypothetical protein